MRSFTDTAGRTWTVELTLGHARRIESQHGIGLLAPSDDHLRELLSTPVAAAVLWQLLAADAAAQGVTREQWEDAVTGVVLAAALEALWTAVADFFQHEPTYLRRWAHVLTAAQEPSTTPTSQNPTTETPPTQTTPPSHSQSHCSPATPGTPSTDSPASSAATGDP